jgi:hypothetical protein
MMQRLFLGLKRAVMLPAFSSLGLVDRPSGDVFLHDKGRQELLSRKMWGRFIAVPSDWWAIHSLSPSVIRTSYCN